MVGLKKRGSALLKCLKGPMTDIARLDARRISIRFASDVAESDIRKVHADYSKNTKSYFPISVQRLDPGTLVSFSIDKSDIARMEWYLSGRPDDDGLRAIFYSIELTFMKGSLPKNPDWNMAALPLRSIDSRLGDIKRSDVISRLIGTPDGVDGAPLCVAVDERVRFAYRMALSYATLKNVEKADGLLLAMLHSSLEMGFCFGLPLSPADAKYWASELGMGKDFQSIARNTRDFLILDSYLTAIFPGMPLECREALLSDHSCYLGALRAGNLHEAMPNDAVEMLGMNRDDIRKRVGHVGLVYG